MRGHRGLQAESTLNVTSVEEWPQMQQTPMILTLEANRAINPHVIDIKLFMEAVA
jgi:hypothetical protein